MKKIILSLVFVFAFGTSFASNNIEKSLKNPETSVKINKITDIQSIQPDTFFKRCKITHRVRDEEGNLMGTVVYSIEISEGTCQGASASLKNLSRELIAELM